MGNLKASLLAEIAKVPGVENRPSPVSGGSALFYNGEAFAHSHDENELDLKLTKRVIKALSLSHSKDSVHYPNRSPNSAWIEVRFKNPSDISRVCKLVKLAIAELDSRPVASRSRGA
jgi:hypothetical protein